MNPSLIKLGQGVYYQKLEKVFKPNEKEQVSILSSRKQYILKGSGIKECVIFYRSDVSIEKFMAKKSKYKDAMNSTKTHLEEKFSEIGHTKNIISAAEYIKSITSALAVQTNYGKTEEELSSIAMEAYTDYDEFMDILNIVTQFKIYTKKYNNLSSDEKNLYLEKINLDSDLSSEAKGDEKLRIVLSFNASKKRYDNLIERSDEKTKNELMDDNFLASKKKILEERLHSADKASSDAKVTNHKSSRKIEFLKAALFEADIESFIKNTIIIEEDKKLQTNNFSKSTLSDSNHLSDKENIAASDTKNKLKDMVENKLSPNSWSIKKASSPRKAEDFLSRKQPKTVTISPDSNSIEEKKSNAFFSKTNDLSDEENRTSLSGDENKVTSRGRSSGKTINAQIADKFLERKQPESSNSESSSSSEKENTRNHPKSNITISPRSARDIGNGILLNPITSNSYKLNKPKN